MPCSEFSFPFQRRCDYLGEVVVPRLPAERGPNTGGACDQRGRVACAPRFFSLGYGVSRDALDHGEQLADAIASAVAAVQCRGFAATAQVGEGLQVGVGEVLHVDVVTYAGAVGCRVVGAENRDVRALPDSDFARNLRQKCRFRRRLSDAALGIRARPR